MGKELLCIVSRHLSLHCIAVQVGKEDTLHKLECKVFEKIYSRRQHPYEAKVTLQLYRAKESGTWLKKQSDRAFTVAICDENLLVSDGNVVDNFVDAPDDAVHLVVTTDTPGIDLNCVNIGDWRPYTVTILPNDTLEILRRQIHRSSRSDSKFEEESDIMWVYRSTRGDEWYRRDDPMFDCPKLQWVVPEDIEDVMCDENLLESDSPIFDVFRNAPEDAVHLVVNYPFTSRELALSTWIPPQIITDLAKPIDIVSVQAPAGCECCEKKRNPIATASVVQGVFVKLSWQNGVLTMDRIRGELPANEVTAISYAWGTLPHEQRIHLANSNDEIKLGNEWDTDKFVSTLVGLSEQNWVWLDQLCLPQEAELSVVLATDIATVYSSCRVCCLVPTLACEKFQALQRETTATGGSDNYAKPVKEHQQSCDCLSNWSVYFSRIWPWQEFAIATNVEIHLELGRHNASYDAPSRPFFTALSQVAVKLTDRFWGGTVEQISESNEKAAALLLLGWGVRSEPRQKVSHFDTLMFVSWLARTQRTATKMVDIFFAMSPMLELASDYEVTGGMTPIDALVAMMNAFQQKLQTYLSGAIPAGLLGASAQTFRPMLDVVDQNQDVFIRNSIDLLPFVAVTTMTQTKGGIVRGFTAPWKTDIVLSQQQSSRVSLRDVVQSMSRNQRAQAAEFVRGKLTAELSETGCLIAGALAGFMDSLFEIGDVQLTNESVQNFNSTVFNTVAVVLGVIPFHAYGQAEMMTGNAALARVDVGLGECGLAIVDDKHCLPDHVCVSRNSTFLGRITSDGRFQVSGRVLGCHPTTGLGVELIGTIEFAQDLSNSMPLV
ncbi:hypothetical protein V7S43_010467 [Phytophthora oleae]|uniref:Heterokaryon incompatibility domain-containing protein n=1 Tax=Phytophthora oleae TaxID=2107226 RepID=A0ABD3FD74_9STRA